MNTLVAVSASAGIRSLEVPQNQRWVQGSSDQNNTNLFLASVMKPGFAGKISCGVNLNTDGASIEREYVRGHDVQVFYISRSKQSFAKTDFVSELTPFTYQF
ncbi:MAG: hypothetical protein EOP04_10340, partial [Proteobacteria bacterium]